VWKLNDALGVNDEKYLITHYNAHQNAQVSLSLCNNYNNNNSERIILRRKMPKKSQRCRSLHIGKTHDQHLEAYCRGILWNIDLNAVGRVRIKLSRFNSQATEWICEWIWAKIWRIMDVRDSLNGDYTNVTFWVSKLWHYLPKEGENHKIFTILNKVMVTWFHELDDSQRTSFIYFISMFICIALPFLVY